MRHKVGVIVDGCLGALCGAERRRDGGSITPGPHGSLRPRPLLHPDVPYDVPDIVPRRGRAARGVSDAPLAVGAQVARKEGEGPRPVQVPGEGAEVADARELGVDHLDLRVVQRRDHPA